MSIDYRTCAEQGNSEIIEKKSRFLGRALHVEDLREAEAAIQEVRKQYYDARHHCFAYVCGEPGTPDEIVRSGDDGEPQGTAGKPMLEVLTGDGLHKTIVIVTRYFGGTLLGTGGLVRAYSAAARKALDVARIVTVHHGTRISVTCDYALYGRFQYLFANEHLRVERTDFAENVTLQLVVPAADEPRVLKLISETSAGRAACRSLGPCTFTV